MTNSKQHGRDPQAFLDSFGQAAQNKMIELVGTILNEKKSEIQAQIDLIQERLDILEA